MAVKIGVFGGRRGDCMIEWCKKIGGADIVAVCDRDRTVTEELKAKYPDGDIAYYEEFDDFVNHDGLDAVVLANYANQHAPYAIRCLEKGLHVLSEVLPCQTLAEAVALVEAVEQSGKIYAYAENYCYMPAPMEMRRLFREGKLGRFEYGEGEYVHNCEPIWADITYGQKNHWRNNMYATFYCTHSLGPLLHITQLRPISVIGVELPYNNAMARMGAKKGAAAMEIVTLENGAVVKSLHGDLNKDNVWYCVYGSKGRVESLRPDSLCNEPQRYYADGTSQVYVNLDSEEGDNIYQPIRYTPADEHLTEKNIGHGGSDYYVMYHFIRALNGDKEADIIGVYEAMDMFLPGVFAYFSVLDGGVSKQVPNLRNREERDRWRHDTRCTDPRVAGKMLIPSYSKNEIEVPDIVYDKIRQQYENKVKEKAK